MIGTVPQHTEADVGRLVRCVLAGRKTVFGWLVVEVVAVELVACDERERMKKRRELAG
jgi:hypothetical protein